MGVWLTGGHWYHKGTPVVGQDRPGGSKTTFHLSPAHATGEGKGNACIVAHKEATLFRHNDGFGITFSLSSIYTSKKKKVTKKSWSIATQSDIDVTDSQALKGWKLTNLKSIS